MRLNSLPADLPSPRLDLQIIPARASFRHARQIAEESARQRGIPSLADASMLYLDDPQWDALLALKDGEAVGRIGVLSVGEIGLIGKCLRGPSVSSPGRRQHDDDQRAIRNLPAASLFRHVLLGVASDNDAAISLYHKFGFTKVADAPTFIIS